MSINRDYFRITEALMQQGQPYVAASAIAAKHIGRKISHEKGAVDNKFGYPEMPEQRKKNDLLKSKKR